MWKPVRILFSNSKPSGQGFSDKKIARAVFLFFLLLSLMIYLSRKVEVNEYLLKEISSGGSASIKININSVTARELENLPYVGQKLAQRIIEYRDTHGSFEKVSDLKKISGIGPQKFLKIQDYLTTQP